MYNHMDTHYKETVKSGKFLLKHYLLRYLELEHEIAEKSSLFQCCQSTFAISVQIMLTFLFFFSFLVSCFSSH